jgi:hypothetical protein
MGFALDAWSAAAAAWRSSLAPYPALSPARIVAELERILADAEPARGAAGLARAGAFRLLSPRYRPTRGGLARLARCRRRSRGCGAHAVAAPPLELLATALAADQPAEIGRGTLRGLGLSGAPLERVRQTLAGAETLAARPAARHDAASGARAPRGEPDRARLAALTATRPPRAARRTLGAMHAERPSSGAGTPSRWAWRRDRTSPRCWPAADGAAEGKFATGRAKSTTLRLGPNRKKEG